MQNDRLKKGGTFLKKSLVELFHEWYDNDIEFKAVIDFVVFEEFKMDTNGRNKNN